jgi:hypothetical protein
MYLFAGGLMLLIQDLALCEEADHATIQPPQHEDQTDATDPHAGLYYNKLFEVCRICE